VYENRRRKEKKREREKVEENKKSENFHSNVSGNNVFQREYFVSSESDERIYPNLGEMC
jgi:hypothetical protein